MVSNDKHASVLKYKLAVASLRKVDDPLRLAHTVRHLGDAYYYAGRASLAEPCYVEALSIYRQHDQSRPLDLANAIRSFALLKDEVGAAEEAQRLWQEAHDIYVAVNVPAGVAESAARLALLARHRGDTQRSRKWLSEAIAAAEVTNDPDTLHYIEGKDTSHEWMLESAQASSFSDIVIFNCGASESSQRRDLLSRSFIWMSVHLAGSSEA